MKRPHKSLRRRLIGAIIEVLVAEMAKKGHVLNGSTSSEHDELTRTVQRATYVVSEFDTHVFLLFTKNKITHWMKFATDGGREPAEMIGDWSFTDTPEGREFNRTMERVVRYVEHAPLIFDRPF